jgi:TfoX/Sxy family transcriptional regulator of competence genes
MAKSTAKKAVAPRKYNEALADNIRLQLTEIPHKIEEKNMFGGLCFMVNDKMCVGVETERMMVRLDPSLTEALLKKPGCRPMEFTGKVMK